MSAPTRADMARSAVFLTALAAQAKVRAEAIRAQLDAQARTELERDGSAPTWRFPELGTVPLSLTQDVVDVTDPAAYVGYVRGRYPTEVETVTAVRPAFDEHLRKQLLKQVREATVVDDEGVIVPGLRFRPGGDPKGVSVRPTPEAKAAAAALADSVLDGLALPGVIR